MNSKNSTKKYKSKKPLYILLIFLSTFGLFLFLITGPSVVNKAMAELEICSNATEVKNVFFKYKTDLIGNEDFYQAARDKMKHFNLSKSEIIEIKTWLPSKTENLNVIIVPDLSNRLIDTINNSNQIRRDSVIISSICENFEAIVKSKSNTNDKLIIDVTDRRQAGEKIGELADTILYDLSRFRNKSNRLYFDGKRNQFRDGVEKLYKYAYDFEIKNPQGGGADYVSYFSTNLKSKLQKSTIDDNYRNVLIILTDGYLEATKPSGDIVSYIKTNPNQIAETVNENFQNLEVYILEINRKKSANDFEELKIKKWWFDWLKSMNVKNFNESEMINEILLKRSNGFLDVKNKIDEILPKR